jgi:hypothetical protein
VGVGERTMGLLLVEDLQVEMQVMHQTAHSHNPALAN